MSNNQVSMENVALLSLKNNQMNMGSIALSEPNKQSSKHGKHCTI